MYLSKKLDMTVVGADVLELPNDTDWQLDGFVPLPQRTSLGKLTAHLTKGLDEVLDGSKFDAIICAAGGWEGDPESLPLDAPMAAVEDGAMKYAATVESMIQKNVYPVMAAGYAAQRYIENEGM